MKEYISHSEMSAWYWGQYRIDKEGIKLEETDWYKQYILGEPQEENREMLTGTIIHEWLNDQRCPIIKKLKDLGYAKREVLVIRKMLNKANKKLAPEREVCLQAEILKGIRVKIIIDNFWREGGIEDWKTTAKIGNWSAFKADYSDQLSLYAAVYKKLFYKYPKWLAIHELEITRGTCKTYYTARGPRDIKHINDKAKAYVDDCKKLGLWDKRLDKDERITIHNKKLCL